MTEYNIHFDLYNPVTNKSTGLKANKPNPCSAVHISDVLIQMAAAFKDGRMQTPIGKLEVIGIVVHKVGE